MKITLLAVAGLFVAFPKPPAFGADAILVRDHHHVVEVPVEILLAPDVGYDDNDTAQIVVHGSLPNGCYRLGETKVERLYGSNSFKVAQFARVRAQGVCADPVGLPEHMSKPVPYMVEVSVGQLDAGDYEFIYKEKLEAAPSTRSVSVARASVPTVDTLPYASVTNAYLHDIIKENEEVEVTVSGVLNNSCTELDERIRVEKRKDVYVLYPLVKMKPEPICAQVITPFERKISLGMAMTGHYLVHVRSMNGKAVNRVTQVIRAKRSNTPSDLE